MHSDVIDVDRMEGGIIVSFRDGTIVQYSAALLRTMIPQAVVLPLIEDPEPED